MMDGMGGMIERMKNSVAGSANASKGVGAFLGFASSSSHPETLAGIELIYVILRSQEYLQLSSIYAV